MAYKGGCVSVAGAKDRNGGEEQWAESGCCSSLFLGAGAVMRRVRRIVF
nr:MAG TPA: hypothetical protein [Caudoviricetes sp.]